MGNESQNHKWIVLIHKSPKGPLGLDEINALIAQGILKRNDAAFLVGAEKTEWKFLWQFEQFDRRIGEEQAKKRPLVQEPSMNTGEDRRGEQKPDISALLPAEIASIEPEDLIAAAKPYIPEPHVEFTENVSFRTGSTISRNFFIAFAFFALVIYQIFKTDEKPRPRAVANTPVALSAPSVAPSAPSRMPLESTGIPQSRPLERMEKVAPRIAPSPLIPRDGGGEISRRDYERRQEEKLEKRAFDDDDGDPAEISDDNGSDDELPARRSRKKKRRVPSSSEEEFRGEGEIDSEFGGESVEMDE